MLWPLYEADVASPQPELFALWHHPDPALKRITWSGIDALARPGAWLDNETLDHLVLRCDAPSGSIEYLPLIDCRLVSHSLAIIAARPKQNPRPAAVGTEFDTTALPRHIMIRDSSRAPPQSSFRSIRAGSTGHSSMPAKMKKASAQWWSSTQSGRVI